MKRNLLVVLAMLLLGSVATGEQIKSFCEYGTGVALRLGAGGALWSQTWGEGRGRPVEPNVGRRCVGMVRVQCHARRRLLEPQLGGHPGNNHCRSPGDRR